MKIIWTEPDRRGAERFYWQQLLTVRELPRWYRKAMAERLALAHLQAAAKSLEAGTDST